MTSIGSERVTPLQWYKGLMVDLLSKFELRGCVNFKQWWTAHEQLSMVQRLRLFIEEILLENLPDTDLFIFVDEIDSALALEFPIDDFFALVRYCYNQRAENPAYGRLTWALFGVVTPSELICDRTRTPFNIGRAIELRGFQFEDAKRLAPGLADDRYDAFALIRAILSWTKGQPFLTQKICRLVSDVLNDRSVINSTDLTQRSATAEDLVQRVVQHQVLEHWETQDDPEHLRTIRDRLLRDELRAPRLLGIYETVLLGAMPQCDVVRPAATALDATEPKANQQQALDRLLAYDDSPDHIDLLLSGLIATHRGRLQVKNPIYQTIFDLSWVKTQLANLRPYARQLDAWILSERTDDSRLLRGKALKDAQAWSQERSVSQVDHDFLMASERYDRQAMQQALKSARLKEVEKRLEGERQARRKQRTLIGLLSGAFAISVLLAAIATVQTGLVKRKELQATVTTAEALYSSDQRLDSLIQAVESVRLFEGLGQRVPKDLRDRMNAVLRISAVNSVERNRLSLPDSNFWDVAVSPDGQQIVTGSSDNKVRLWQANGELIQVFSGH
ncbi:MAG: AAA-like domain-containing protein, partial [Cyanobacteria bacterium J06598_3]